MASNQRDPIFVLGYQRSGTTLLQSMLGAHPAIAGPPEIYFFMRIAALEAYYGDLHDDANLRRALHDMIHIETLGGYCLDEEEMFASLREGPRTYRELLTTLMDTLAARQGKRRWSEKSPGQRAGQILRLFPDAKLIHIVRDPRDTVASALAAPWVEAGARRVALDVRDHLRSAMHAAAQVGPDRYLRVRYEHLTEQTETVLRQVCGFVGEDFDPGMLDPRKRAEAGTVVDVARPWQRGVSEPVRTDRQGMWRTRLGRFDQARVAAALRREVHDLGYPHPMRRHVLLGQLLDITARPADLRRSRERRRFARRVRQEGPAVLRERVREHLERQRVLVEDSRPAQ